MKRVFEGPRYLKNVSLKRKAEFEVLKTCIDLKRRNTHIHVTLCNIVIYASKLYWLC